MKCSKNRPEKSKMFVSVGSFFVRKKLLDAKIVAKFPKFDWNVSGTFWSGI